MAFAILRTEKLKTFGNVGGAAAHVQRTLENDPANIDPSRTHLNVKMKGENVVADVKKALPKKYRKNAVIAVESMITASPEFFHGMSSEDVMLWADKSLAWAEGFWGKDNVVGATLHLDEGSPHIHLFSVPKLGEKLNCRMILGGKGRLAAMQTSYHQAVECFGLERGIEGSTRKHKTMRQITGEAERSAKKPVMHDVEIVRKTHKNVFGQTVLDKAESVKAVEPVAAFALHATATKVPLLQGQKKALEKQVRSLQKQAEYSALRELNLRSLALDLGYKQDEKDPAVFSAAGCKVSINNQKFFDFGNDVGGGGAIDLVMHTEQLSFKQATALLADVGMGESYVASAVAAKAIAENSREIKGERSVLLVKPKHDPALDSKLEKWLGEVRKIPRSVVKDWMNKGLVYASKFQRSWQAVFKQNDRAFLRVNPETGFRGYVRGSDLSKPLILPSTGEKIAIVEGHVDAMSFQALYPDMDVCVSNGTAGAAKAALQLRRGNKKVVLALDNDKAGKEATANIIETISGYDFEIMTPKGKDWNDGLVEALAAQAADLKMREDYMRDFTNENNDLGMK